MESDMNSTDTMDTIGTLWLKNVYENLKLLEHHERLARSGCTSIEAYAQMVTSFPLNEVKIMINDIQLQNLKSIIGEMHLLLTDLTPILDEKILERFHVTLDNLDSGVKKKNYLLIEAHSLPRNRMIQTTLTPEFYMYLEILSKMRRVVIKDIKHILYTQNTSKETTKKIDALRAEYG